MVSETHSRLIKLALISSISVGTIILLLKIYAVIVTGSVSILASLIDAGLDLSVSIMNYFIVRYSLEPPDDRHRFGHDKIQDLGVFAQAIFFFGSGVFAIICAIKHSLSGCEIKNSQVGISVMAISIVITFVLLIFQTYVIRKTNSTIIKADKLHYFTDLCTNFVVIIGVYFGKEYPLIDVVLGSLISIYIMYGSYVLLKSSLKNLIDEEFDDKEKEILLAILAKFEEVKGLHDLKTRRAANKPFIQFHIELDGSINLYNAHEITEKIMDEISKVFIGAEIIIHQDPEGIEEDVQYRESL